MARDENPPFERGKTWYGGATPDANDLGGDNIVGQEWVFEDVDPTTGAKRTEFPVRCRAVRNVSGVNLLPGYLAQFDVTNAGKYGSEVAGYSNTTAGEGYPIDEYLPAAGVVDDDIFWIVIEGPAEVVTSVSADASNVFNLGGWGVAETAASSVVSTTAGRIEAQVLTGATALLADQIQNRIGRALTARTTANTDTDTLFYVGKV